MKYRLADLAFNPAEPRDRRGRWSLGELHALESWVKGRGGVRRIQHGQMHADFTSALNKLPLSEGPLYRGVKGAGADRQAALNPGDMVHWDAPRSASTRADKAFAFGSNLYRIEGAQGRVLTDEHLPNAYEHEAILPPGDYTVVSRDDNGVVRVMGKKYPTSVVTLRPKGSMIDLASPGVNRRERPVVKHVVPIPVDADSTVRHIAKVLLASARFERVPSDYRVEVDALTHLLKPYNIGPDAIRMALGLTHTEGGSRRGTAHLPNARLAEHGARLDTQVRKVRDNEVYFRSAYVANAAHRMQRAMNAGATQTEALRREAPYYRAHEEARKGRLSAVAQVQRAADMFGWADDRGKLVGWYMNPLLKNEVECITANGHNFYAEEGTVIGLPGSVHNRCGCYAGPPIEGATLVNEALHNVVKFQRSRPKFKLKERRTA